ncbi:hypothetical protein GIB67_017828 [Kingdonia uniflora]|uniref:Uncharacterized protein n=1 Tax=Kingdonia uniflora TaxID=39325 RepID=A0A7J7MPK6_9MAGN|nr:hypothetical protein GIB67_017828 [Kingdonia uniflora]
MEEGRNNLVFAINGVRFEFLVCTSKLYCTTNSSKRIENTVEFLLRTICIDNLSSISKEATNVACSDNPSSDSREVEKTSTDIGTCPKTVNIQDLKQPMAFLLSAVAETGLVSLPSLLTAVLLQVNTRLSSEQGSYVFPSNFEEAVTGVLKVLNNLALLDITLLQGMLTMSKAKDLKDLKNAVMGSESNGDDTKDKFDPEKHIDAHLPVSVNEKRVSNLLQFLLPPLNQFWERMLLLFITPENSILERAKELCSSLSNASEDITALHSKIVSEYEVIIRDIKNSLDEQKQVVTLSAQQQEEEQSTREEKLALEKIAAILRTLTSNKTYTVSKAMRNMDTENTEVKKMLEQEMVNIQNISVDARKEWKGYIEKVESQFMEGTFSAADTKAAIESNLQECSNKVDSSRKHWEDAQLGINQLIKCSTEEIDSIIADKCSGNQVAFENFASVSSSTDAEFNSRACDLLTTVNGFWKIMLLLWWSLYHLNTLPLFQCVLG